MNRKSMRVHQKMVSLVLIAIVVLSLGAVSIQSAFAQEPSWLFRITLLAPTANPVRVQYAQLITNELPRIGIDANLLLIGWDEYIPRMMGSSTHADYNNGGFDIGFLGWSVSHEPSNLFNFYHSSNIDPTNWDVNYHPVNNKTLDGILELTMNTTDFEQRKNYIQQALEMIVWDIHPVTGIFQDEDIFCMRDNIGGFDAERFPRIEEIYFTDGSSTNHGNATKLIVAGVSQPNDYNPLISNSWYDRFVIDSVFSSLLAKDSDLMFVPELAAQLPYPVAVKNNYTGEISSTNVNTATVWELKLRNDIFWHEGYGYRMNNATHREILRFDADDVVWHYNTLLSADGPMKYRFHSENYQSVFGSEPEKAIIKVDRYTVQFHLSNLYADLFSLFGFVLPQHILDPLYNPLGQGPGVRADGTSAPSWTSQSWDADDFNLGRRTSGDWEHPATIGTGAYTLYPGVDLNGQTITLSTWNHYFKDNDSTYWKSLVEKRPDKYIYYWTQNRDIAKTGLETGTIDILDTSLTWGKDFYLEIKVKPGITIVKKLICGYHTMGYNILHGADNHLTNNWVRLAISHMVPRQDIVDYLVGGLGQPNSVPFPRQSPFWPDTLEPLEYNYTKAISYLIKAGYDPSCCIPSQNISGFEALAFFIALSGMTSIIHFVRLKKLKNRRF
ncbi:MAG: ABC transporter substrate-binding protein [Candidatus Hodarchaeota archaeon]